MQTPARPLAVKSIVICNRYRMTAKQAELAARYGISSPYPDDLTVPPPELFPDKPAYVVREAGGARILDAMSWGFPHKVPGKRIDKASGKPVLLDKKVTNVRNYTSPFWKSALQNPERRCLVPFTAFSEYGQTRGEEGKLPLHWFDVSSRPIVSFAGIWRPAEGGAVFAFLTTEPNSLVAPIHPKRCRCCCTMRTRIVGYAHRWLKRWSWWRLIPPS